ncbi:MAG: AAA family ATPase [Deltaproteobacteria bacterium]|nr:AAA family ATPase [Deltaproteobacteria bacterium]
MERHLFYTKRIYSAKWAAKYALMTVASASPLVYTLYKKASFINDPNMQDIAMTAAVVLSPSLIITPGMLVIQQAIYMVQPPEVLEESHIINYAAKKLFFEKSMQTYLEEEVFYDYWRNQTDEARNKLSKILEIALKLPVASKELEYDSDKIRQALHLFPANIQETLDLFALNEIAIQTFGSAVETRYPLYLVGKPGTGKSFSVKTLAKTIGSDMSVVNLDGASIEDIIGSSLNSSNPKPGRLLEAITSTVDSATDINYSNQILFIDEFDRLLISTDTKSEDVLSFMLKLLDPDVRYFYSPYLKSMVKLPETIILAGNFDIEELIAKKDTLEALASRLEFVRYSGYAPEIKHQLVWESLVPSLLKSYTSSSDPRYAFDGLTQSDKDDINQFLQNDTDPGLRSAGKFVNRVIQRAFARQYKNKSKKHRSTQPLAVCQPWKGSTTTFPGENSYTSIPPTTARSC